MKRMLKKDFLVEVIEEINHLKANASMEELNKLDTNEFIHHHRDACIYGQMTGECQSPRAHQLYPKKYRDIGSFCITHLSFSKQSFAKSEKNNYFTPLEKYLYMVKKSMHNQIIAYLKGETDTLNLI